MIGFVIAFVIFAALFVVVFGIQTDKIIAVLEKLNASLWIVSDTLESIAEASDEMRISDEVVDALKRRASRDFSEVPPAELETYQKGLKDGETMTAQYVLGEVEEED
jgi:hypothetical protein